MQVEFGFFLRKDLRENLSIRSGLPPENQGMPPAAIFLAVETAAPFAVADDSAHASGRFPPSMIAPLPSVNTRSQELVVPLLFLTVLFLFVHAPLRGEFTDPNEPQYNRRVWQTEDGLRNPMIRAITQSRDGYLWIATDDGLVRFDGVRFREFDNRIVTESHSRWVVDVTETRDGSIWTSSSNGGVTRIKDGALTRFTRDDGLHHEFILALHEDRSGRLWLGSAIGLMTYEGDGHFYSWPEENGWKARAVRRFAEDKEGTLWIATSIGLVRYKNGVFEEFRKEDGWLVDNSVMTVSVDRAGNIWAGTSAGLSVLWADGGVNHYTIANGLAHDAIRVIWEDRRGAIWIGTHGGLQQYQDGKFVSVAFHDRMSAQHTEEIPDLVYSIYEDREGNLWAGTNLGLNQITLRRFQTLSRSDGLPHDLITTVREDNEGGVWIATWGGGLSLYKDGEIATWTMNDGLASDHVLALCEDQSGSLWIGTDGFGMNRFANGEFETYTFPDGRAVNTIRVIFEDSQGRIWVGSNAGLRLFVDGHFVSADELFGLKLETIAVITEDVNETLWIGSADGLTRLDGESFRTWTTEEGLSSNIVITIYPDAAGVLWVGTEAGGLNRIGPGGEIFHFASEEGLFRERILHILEDDGGDFWMTSRRGIFRVARDELNAAAAGEIPVSALSPIAYGKADGMRRAQCNGIAQPAGWKSRDDRFWFPTMSGVVIFDPERTPVNQVPPLVVIERAMIEGEPVPVDEEELELPPGARLFEARYTAPSLQGPEQVRFRYILEGFETEWHDAGRQRSAIYHHLPPGSYRFRVTASNNDGVWSEEGASLAFTLKPHFYQTVWFYVICALALTLSGAGAYRLRVRWMRRRHHELMLLVDERTAKLQEEIRERVTAQRRTLAFSRLGQQLSLVSTQVEAAETIVAAADELIGWDACCLHSYSQEVDLKAPVLMYDWIDGRRMRVDPMERDARISPMMRKILSEGAQLCLREKEEEDDSVIPFGDRTRRSLSLMFTPMRKGDEVVGVVSIQSYSLNAFTRDDLETLQALADYCAGAFERIRAEEALRESQEAMLHQERLAAIGQLSSGAAHEFNNILTIIQGHSHLLLKDNILAGKSLTSLREIAESAERAANLTRQLLTFSRKQFMRPRVLDLNACIQELVSMLSQVLGENVKIICRLDPKAPAVQADPGMMEQIVMNLAVNARDAMADKGGELTISTRTAEITQRHPHPEARAGSFVLLRVADTGCGMDPATLRRIFEPFFTTKGVGKGTGLGLASVYGIVKQHRGWLEVSSRPGEGSCFDIYLPATESVPAVEPQADAIPASRQPPSGGKETILLVEDEAGLRKLAVGFLEAMGYQVLEAADGTEAIQVWELQSDRIDLVFTDMVLPGAISGRDIAERIRAQEPSFPVILTSGYSKEILGGDLPADEMLVFLPKPYAPADVGALIRRLLNLRVRAEERQNV